MLFVHADLVKSISIVMVFWLKANLGFFDMREKSFISESHIIDCLKINYGIEIDSLIRLSLGADIDALVYKAQAHSQLTYFVKVRPGHCHDISTMIVEMLQNAGIQEMIPIVKTIHGQAIQPIDDFVLTVFPFVKGQDGFKRELTDNQWYRLGKVMRQIHEMKMPSSIQAKIRKESYPSKWRKIVQSFNPLIESEPNGDTIALQMLKFMKEHKDIIDRLLSQAEELAQLVQNQSFQDVLCHADLHGGNILIDDDDRFYIVDWDDSILAPKERDLMFIGGGVGNIWNKPHETDLFYKGYGEVDVNITLLSYYRHERILEDIAIYGQQLLLSSAGGGDRMKWYQEFVDQFDPQGVVDIALR